MWRKNFLLLDWLNQTKTPELERKWNVLKSYREVYYGCEGPRSGAKFQRSRRD